MMLREDVEDKLADLFAEVIGIDASFDRNRSFASLGGQSLMAMRLQVAIMREFKVKVTFADMRRNETVGALASLVCERAGADAPSATGRGAGRDGCAEVAGD